MLKIAQILHQWAFSIDQLYFPSLAHSFNWSLLFFETWEYLSTKISAWLLMFGLWRIVSRCFTNFVTSVNTLLMAVFTLWSCHLFIVDSTMATSSWLSFLPISRDNFSQSSMLRLIWCFNFVVIISVVTVLLLPRRFGFQ